MRSHLTRRTGITSMENLVRAVTRGVIRFSNFVRKEVRVELITLCRGEGTMAEEGRLLLGRGRSLAFRNATFKAILNMGAHMFHQF